MRDNGMIHANVIGNLGSAAETKTIPSGKLVTNFSVATKGRGKETDTTWVRCAMWGERGKKVSEFLTKGAKVAAIGTLTARIHEGKTYLELDVQELELLGSKPSSGSSNDEEIPF